MYLRQYVKMKCKGQPDSSGKKSSICKSVLKEKMSRQSVKKNEEEPFEIDINTEHNRKEKEKKGKNLFLSLSFFLSFTNYTKQSNQSI